MITDEQKEKNLNAFIAGVKKAHEEAGVETDECTDIFWANVIGNEFENEETAFDGGMEIAENELHNNEGITLAQSIGIHTSGLVKGSKAFADKQEWLENLLDENSINYEVFEENGEILYLAPGEEPAREREIARII